MSTLIVDVDQEQEKVLETLLTYMGASFQKVETSDDFWNHLSPTTRQHIEKGLSDAKAGRYTSATEVMNQLAAL
jgi:DNA-binding NtrC family response regulator